MFATLARLVANRSVAWATVITVLLLAGLSLHLSRRLVHEDDILAFLPRDNPEVRSFHDINKRFGGLDVALVGIEADDVLSPDFLDRLRRVTRELRETQGLNHVLSLANVLDFAPDREHGGIVTGPLISSLPRSPEEQRELRTKVMSRDLIVGNLVSAEGRAALIYCFLAFGSDTRTVTTEIKRVVESAFPGQRKYWGGNPFISTYIYSTTQEDIRRLTPWAGLAIVLIMMIAFRDVTATILALLSTGIGISFSLGLMAAFGVRFNIVLGSMPIIMLALGSAYAIHVLARYYSLAQECDTETAIARTVTGVGPTVLAAGLTTVISLLSLVCMDIQPLRTFGLFTAIGLTAKLILSLTFIPAVMRLLNVKRKPASSLLIRRGMAHVATFAQAHRFAVGGVLALLVIVGLSFAIRIDPRMDQSAFFSAGSPPDEAEKYLRQHFGGSQFVQLHLRGDMTDPHVLREVQRMADEVALLPRVTSVSHLAQAVGQINNAMTGQRRVPDTAAQVRLLYTFLAGDPSVAQLVAPEHTEALVQVKLDASRAAELETVLAQVEGWARKQAQDYVVVPANGPRQAEAKARQRALVLSRIRAAAHANGIDLSAEQIARLGQDLGYRPDRIESSPIEAGLVSFLRSDEATVELPPASEGNDPAARAAAALAALGPDPTEERVTGALAGALAKAPEDPLVEDLSLALTAPLKELWSAQIAAQRAHHLLQQAGLGHGSPAFSSAVAAALLDLDAPSVLLPGPAASGPVAAAVATGSSSLRLGLQVSGQPVMDRGLSRSVIGNQIRSVCFALLFVFVVMSILFRSVISGLLAMTPALLTGVVIYGGMGLLGVRLDIGTSMLGSIIIGAGVDYAIHLVAAWRAPSGGTLRAAAAHGSDRAGLAVWTNAVMIAAGFFVLTLGQARPLKNVGGLTSAAMICAALATFVIIPVLARKTSYTRAHQGDAEVDELDVVPPSRESAADRLGR